ncbi:MAG: hypothetical protein LLF94_06420, partial [Chlamydiales bacterium]|nr:hypothetical protein [Chlamydiales bacterium]
KVDRQSVCKSVSKLFISCIGSSGVEKRYANNTLPQTSRETIVWKIKQVMQGAPLPPATDTDEDFDFESIFINRDTPLTVFKNEPDIANPTQRLIAKNKEVFESILGINTDYLLSKKTDKDLEQVVENVIQPHIQKCIASKADLLKVGNTWISYGKYAKSDTLAHAAVTRIWQGLEQVATKAPDEESIAILTAAKCVLLNAGIGLDGGVNLQQAARAWAVIQLRELVPNPEGLGFYTDASQNFFTAAFLESVTTDEIKELYARAQVDNQELAQEIANLPPDSAKATVVEQATTVTPLVTDIIHTDKQRSMLIRQTEMAIKKVCSDVLGIDIETALANLTSVDEKMEYLTNLFSNTNQFEAGSPGDQFLLQLGDISNIARKKHERYDITNTGSLAQGVFSAIGWNIRNLKEELKNPTHDGQIYQQERLQRIQVFIAVLAEAKALMYAAGHKNCTASEQVQHKRAVILLELRSLYRKANEVAAPGLVITVDPKVMQDLGKDLAGPSGFVDPHKFIFSEKRLATITDAELDALYKKFSQAMLPLEAGWNKDLTYESKTIKALPVLKDELTKSFKSLHEFEKKLPLKMKHKLEGILEGSDNRYKKEASLAHGVYKKMNAALHAGHDVIAEAEWLIAAHDEEDSRYVQAQVASKLLELRELVLVAQEAIAAQKRHFKKQVNLKMNEEMAQVVQRLGGKSGFADSKELLFSQERLQTIKPEELQYLFKKLIEVVQPIITSGRWPTFGPLRREFELRL